MSRRNFKNKISIILYFIKYLQPQHFLNYLFTVLFVTLFFCMKGYTCEEISYEDNYKESIFSGITTSESDDEEIKYEIINSELSELDDDSSIEQRKKQKRPDSWGSFRLSKTIRGTSDGKPFEIPYESQETTLNISHCNASQYQNPVLSVDIFLRKCAQRLGIYENPFLESFFFLPYDHDKSHLISVRYKNIHGEIDHYRVYDPDHRLMNGQNFVPSDRASGGTRIVGFYSIDGRRRLCFKQHPEAPAHDIATYKLYNMIFPEETEECPIPIAETILINDQVFLISEFIEGETLEQVLKKVESDPAYGADWIFDTNQIKKSVLFSSFINPEDGRTQNYLFSPVLGSTKMRIYLLDHDRSLGSADVEYNHPEMGKLKTRVHCALLCFHELLEGTFRQEIISRISENFRAGISRWASECHEESLYQRKLQKLIPMYSLKSILGVVYSEELISSIFFKIKKIREACVNEEESFIKVFCSASPELATIYKISTNDTGMSTPTKKSILQLALTRIHLIDGGRAGLTTPPSSYIPIENYLQPKLKPFISLHNNPPPSTKLQRSRSTPY